MTLVAWLIHHPRTTMAILAAVWVAGYAVSCWWFPFGKCWCCHGRGTHSRKDGKVFRDCKWICKGTGRRRRIGRTAYEAGRRLIKNV